MPEVKKGGIKAGKTQPEAGAQTVESNPGAAKDIVALYEEAEATSRGRGGGAGVGADEIRKTCRDLLAAKKTDKILLSAVVRALSKLTGKKVQNGTVRSAAKKEFKLEKDAENRVWIIKQ